MISLYWLLISQSWLFIQSLNEFDITEMSECLNTTKTVFTPHYLGFNILKEKFGQLNKTFCDFDVVAFPCNQFGAQEPGTNYEILNCLKYVRPGGLYEPNFHVFSKIFVNGEEEHPLFTFIKNACPSPNGYIGHQFTLLWELIRNNDINWNFAKFLIDHRGHPYRRYMPIVHPLRLQADIQDLIERCEKEYN
ncbi:hypothetical protein HZS_7005 [Henneguya salminicola]|nr:hypothetical protein HZS_7005 [Henneguya salminicola]